MEPILVYGYPAGSSMGLVAALEWLGKPYKLCRVDMLSEMRQESYKRINPRVETPALVTDRRDVITETMAIARWLEVRDTARAIASTAGAAPTMATPSSVQSWPYRRSATNPRRIRRSRSLSREAKNPEAAILLPPSNTLARGWALPVYWSPSTGRAATMISCGRPRRCAGKSPGRSRFAPCEKPSTPAKPPALSLRAFAWRSSSSRGWRIPQPVR